MARLEHPFKAEVEAVRSIILKGSASIQERVKWNAPSFYYAKDFGAFNLHQKDFAQLVLLFPNGLIEDPTGLLDGDFKDRRTARFCSAADVKKKSAALRKIVQQWVALMDQAD
jgi:hypothetical protein